MFRLLTNFNTSNTEGVNHSILIIVGTPNTAITNSRIERPFEIRAMKIPTNGDQLIHHPQ